MENQIKIGYMCQLAQDVLGYKADSIDGSQTDEASVTVALSCYYLACKAARVDGQKLLSAVKSVYRHNQKVIKTGEKPVRIKRRHTAYFLEV